MPGAEPSLCVTSPTSRPTRGNYDEAELALQQAILGSHAVGADAVPSGLTLRLAYVYALEGRTEEADAWFDEAIADAERQRYVPTLALAYNLRGVTLRRRGLLDEAERCHRDALALYRRSRRLRV